MVRGTGLKVFIFVASMSILNSGVSCRVRPTTAVDTLDMPWRNVSKDQPAITGNLWDAPRHSGFNIFRPPLSVPCLSKCRLDTLSLNACLSNIGPIQIQSLDNVSLPWSWHTLWKKKKLCSKTITWFSHSGPDNSNVIVILWKMVLTSQSFSKSSISLDPSCKSILLAAQLLLSCFHREMRKLRSWFKFSELAVGRTGARNSVFLCSLPSCSLLSTTLTFISWCLCA